MGEATPHSEIEGVAAIYGQRQIMICRWCRQVQMSSDIGDTVVDEPTPQDVLEALEQDLCQIEVEDQPIATRKDSEDDFLGEGPLVGNEPVPPVEVGDKINPTLRARFTIDLRGGG